MTGAESIPLSTVGSYAFPVAALALGGAMVRRDAAVRFALGLAVAGLLVFVLFKETGPRQYNANFAWQAIVTNYVLFLAMLAAVARWLRAGRFGWRQSLVLAAFTLHVVAGVHWLFDWLVHGLV